MNNKKTNHRISDIVSIVLFLAIIFGFFSAFLIMPDNERNNYDGVLQQFPNASDYANDYNGADYVLHGKMADDMDEYFCDQFPLRKQFVTLKALAETLSFRSVNNGILRSGKYLVNTRFDSMGIEGSTEFYSKQHVETTLTALKAALETVDVPVNVMLPPRAIDVIGPTINYPTYVGDTLNEQAKSILGEYYVDVLPTLRGMMEGDEAILPYYSTDHHWNTVGAFYGMECWMREWMDVAANYESYDFEPVKFDFLGTSGRNGNYFDHPGEQLDLIRFDGDQLIMVEFGKEYDRMVTKRRGLYDMEALFGPDPYNVYLYGKNNFTRISMDGVERETILVIKDSFAHNMVPFLSRYYDVVMVDLDGVNNIDLSDLAKKTGASRVLVLYNMENVIETDRLGTLS